MVTNHADLPLPVKIAAIIKEGEQYYLIIGEGDHNCIRYQLSWSLVVKLAYEAMIIVFGGIK